MRLAGGVGYLIVGKGIVVGGVKGEDRVRIVLAEEFNGQRSSRVKPEPVNPHSVRPVLLHQLPVLAPEVFLVNRLGFLGDDGKGLVGIGLNVIELGVMIENRGIIIKEGDPCLPAQLGEPGGVIRIGLPAGQRGVEVADAVMPLGLHDVVIEPDVPADLYPFIDPGEGAVEVEIAVLIHHRLVELDEIPVPVQAGAELELIHDPESRLFPPLPVSGTVIPAPAGPRRGETDNPHHNPPCLSPHHKTSTVVMCVGELEKCEKGGKETDRELESWRLRKFVFLGFSNPGGCSEAV